MSTARFPFVHIARHGFAHVDADTFRLVFRVKFRVPQIAQTIQFAFIAAADSAAAPEIQMDFLIGDFLTRRRDERRRRRRRLRLRRTTKEPKKPRVTECHSNDVLFSFGLRASTRLRQHDGGFPVPEHERRDDLLRLPDDHQQIRADQTQVLLQVRHALKLETRAVPSRLGRAPCAALEEARVEAVHGQDLDVRVRRRERLGALDDVVIRQTQVVPEPHHHARRRGGHRRARVRRSRLRRSRIRRRAGGERPERGAGRGEGDARAPRACLGARERPGSGRDVRARGPVAAGRQ